MIKIIKRCDEFSNGAKKARMEIAIGSTAELVTEYEGITLTDGSIAWVVSTGEFYGLLDDTWYNQDGSGAYGSKTEQSRKDTATLDDTKDIVIPPVTDTIEILDRPDGNLAEAKGKEVDDAARNFES